MNSNCLLYTSFVHNTKKIDDNILIALDILCEYKGRFVKFYRGNFPVYITFLTKENLLYHIIVADDGNKKGIIKLVNSYPLSLPKADRLILAFPTREEVDEIQCEIPFLYCTYPVSYTHLDVYKRQLKDTYL